MQTTNTSSQSRGKHTGRILPPGGYRSDVGLPLPRNDHTFFRHPEKTAKGLSLLPSIFLHNPAKARKDIQDMADLYKNDLPMPYDCPASLDAELASWEVRFV